MQSLSSIWFNLIFFIGIRTRNDPNQTTLIQELKKYMLNENDVNLKSPIRLDFLLLSHNSVI